MCIRSSAQLASMATENPMRILENRGAGKWSSSRSTAAFASSATSVVNDELGLLLNIDRTPSYAAPNRSGSAPPSIEGSFVAFDHLLNKQPLSGFENSHPEDLLQFDPHLNSDVNPMLHPLRKSIHLGRHPVYMPGTSLSTHEEEPEGDKSDYRENNTGIMLGHNRLSSNNRHKSLVDLIQEDFPRTPSPLFSQNHSSSNVEEPFDHDIRSLSLDSLSLKSSKPPEPKSGSKVDLSHRSTSAEEPSETSALDAPRSSLAPQKDELISKDAYFTSDFMRVGTIDSDAPNRGEDDPDEQEPGFEEQVELHVQNTHSQLPVGYHVLGSQAQGIGSQSTNNYMGPHGHVKNTSVEMQPLLHSPGGPPPFYATTAAYMTPGSSYYPNFSTSGLYTPQYSGYAMNSSYLTPYLAGYPPHTSFPLPFNPNSGQSFSGQNVGFPTGESISKGSVIQNLNRFYGQHGLTMHPTYPDPLSLQYFQQGVQDPYSVPLQFSHLPSPGPVSNRVDPFSLQNDPTSAALSGDLRFPLSPSGSVGIPNARKVGIPSNNYLNSPTGLGFVPQFRASPLGSPVLPESPAGGANSFGRQYDAGFSQNTAKNVGGYARWQGQRGADNINDHRKHSFLEELKASSARRIDISDIVGRIVEFSIDQHGSRFIQQKLENCSVDEKELVFKEVLPHASKLMTDVFGNYVIQKFFEHGTYEQRKELAGQLSKQMLPLSMQMYGCRVIQKALEVIEVDQKTDLVLELDGHVMKCVRDQNGNHVIQKCIECVPPEKIDFIISAFKSQVASLSTHPYGCRVIQRVLEHCSDDIRCRPIVDEIMEAAYDLAHDQYGNYVTQHVLARGKPFERSQIISKLLGKIVPMSQHKYASNVVEKCLEYGGSGERECLIEEILVQSEESDNLLGMMKDQFANYVVQKIIEISKGGQRERILERIRAHLIALKKYTYGKHIVARFEQLMSEDNGSYEA